MLCEGRLIGIEIELNKLESKYLAFFEVKDVYKKTGYWVMKYSPRTDNAKLLLSKSKMNEQFICDVGKDSEGKWRIFDIFNSIEVFK